MHLSRRRFLIGSAAWMAAAPALAQSSSERVAVYIVPLDDFPEDLAAHVAMVLEADMGERIRPAMRLPPLDMPILPGSNQVSGGHLIERAAAASAALPNAGPGTYRVFLTRHDLNTHLGGFRYQFSMHLPDLNCSVVSVARLEPGDAATGISERGVQRLLKLTKRAIGELHLGWRRSPDRHDLMYAPLMSVTDIDRLGTEHRAAAGDGLGPGRRVALLDELRYMVEDNRRIAGFAGVLTMAGVMRAAATKPETQLVGEWMLARHAGQARGIAAVALPCMLLLLLYKGAALLQAHWALLALLAILLLAAGWLMADVHGSTLRYNEKTLEYRRLLRRPVSVRLDADTVVESHPHAPVFTVRDSQGNAIRFRTDYRSGAIALVNYLVHRERDAA